MFSYPGFFSREPVIAAIELVEDSVVLEISYDDFMSLKERFNEVPLLVEKIRGYYERLRVGRTSDFVNLSANDRYKKFYQAHSIFQCCQAKD